MKINKLSVIFLFFIGALGVNAQQIQIRTAVDSTIPVMSTQQMLNSHVFNNNSMFKDRGAQFEQPNKVHITEEADTLNHRQFNSSGPFGDDSPDNILDKYSLKPSSNSLSQGLPNFSEDLLNGKVNVSIPLVEFEYYDYKIPVFLNNRYPQDLSQPFGEPTFYLNSRVGGDWTLSIDQFKVSRQLNGVEDEHPTKGYYTSNSQNKVNNPISITNEDVHNGLKGEWDTSVDIFHFTTPTISGSFFIDIQQNRYEILTDEKFHVEYQIQNNKLHQFNITDNEGNKYLFGGDNSTIEVSQSITDVVSTGAYIDQSSSQRNLRFVIETNTSGGLLSVGEKPANSNLYVNSPYTGPWNPQTTGQIINTIIASGSINSTSNYLTLVGSENGRKYYALPDFDNYRGSYMFEQTFDDPDMRREKMNTAWYLKEIELFNGKKIFLTYDNSQWKAYPTFASNKVQVETVTSPSDFTYNYVSGNDGYVASLGGLHVYGCFPEVLEFPKFPINESHSVTTHFVKKPELTSIFDEERFQYLGIGSNSQSQAPYYGPPNIYTNAPPETIGNGASSKLIKTLNYFVKDCYPIPSCGKTIEFVTHSNIVTIQDENGDYWRLPHRDRSFLDEIIVNDQLNYTFDYENSRLKKINYPTGGSKEFFYTSYFDNDSARIFFNSSPFSLSGSSSTINPKYINTDIVEKVLTTSEGNVTEESYTFSSFIGLIGRHHTNKTFRPDLPACSSWARLSSTTPVYNSHGLKGGISYQNANKYINGKLQLTVTHNTLIEESNYFNNTLRLIDESTPNYLDDIGRPRTYLDEQIGYLTESKQFKTTPNTNDSVEISQSVFEREYDSNVFAYPSIYLAKIEAGPWQNTNGAVRLGYSQYFYPIESNILSIQGNDIIYEGNNYINRYSKSYFERTYIPQIGLNNQRLSRTVTNTSDGDFNVANFISPIEIEELSSTYGNVNIQNSVFEKFLTRNNVPAVETVKYKAPDLPHINNGQVLGVSSLKYAFTPVNNNGYRSPVLNRSKSIEIETLFELNQFEEQHIHISDPNNIVFDDRLTDNVIYDLYDENGRILEFHSAEDNVYTSVIWGYKDQLPIATIKNARYSEIANYVDDIKYDSNFFASQEIRDAIQDLRNFLPNAQITSYTYKASEVESITDVKGNTIFYEYDDSLRLIKTKDIDGNLLTQYKYHYKNVVDDPIRGSIAKSLDASTNTVTFTAENITGGSGNYNYMWSIIEGGVQSGNSTSSSFDVIYDCLAGDDRVRVNLLIEDAQDPFNTLSITTNFWDLDCCPIVTADPITIDEIRGGEPYTTFYGVELEVVDVHGGCGPLRYDWKYRLANNPGQLNDLSTVIDSSVEFISKSTLEAEGICDDDVQFECHITDLGSDEPVQPIYYFQSQTIPIDCSDIPH